MDGHHIATGHQSTYVVAHSGTCLVQIIENGPDSIHWLIVREGSSEQRIALSHTTLKLLCRAAGLYPEFMNAKDEVKL